MRHRLPAAAVAHSNRAKSPRSPRLLGPPDLRQCVAATGLLAVAGTARSGADRSDAGQAPGLPFGGVARAFRDSSWTAR